MGSPTHQPDDADRPSRASRTTTGALAALAAACLLVQGLHLARWLLAGEEMGHDWGYFLPMLLEGHFQLREKGFSHLPWFTPSLCGGIPFLPNPQSVYLSPLQALFELLGPRPAVFSFAVAYTSLGFLGAWMLGRRGLGLSREAALAGAALFALNGFSRTRFVVGHAAFAPLLLLPWIAWALVGGRPSIRGDLSRGLFAGAGIAFLFLGGLVHGLLPSLLSLALVAAIGAVGMPHGQVPVGAWARRVGVAAASAPLLAAIKLVPATAFFLQFPREGYSLPGFPSAIDAAATTLRALFWRPPVEAGARMEGLDWPLGPHEWDFGLGPAAALLLLVRFRDGGSAHRRERRAARLLLVVMLLLPVALNFAAPGWSTFLEAVPVIGSSSSLIRWWAAYLLPIGLLAAAAVDHVAATPARRLAVTAAVVAATLVWHLSAPLEAVGRGYRPDTIEAGFALDRTPPIRAVGVLPDLEGRPDLGSQRNDSLVAGVSQLACYEPIFGYRLESFPRGPLRAGPAMLDLGGVLNVKDPSCFLYPGSNGCRPGDHVPATEAARAAAFLARRPIPFAAPPVHRWAVTASALGWALVAGLGLARAARHVVRRLSPTGRSHSGSGD